MSKEGLPCAPLLTCLPDTGNWRRCGAQLSGTLKPAEKGPPQKLHAQHAPAGACRQQRALRSWCVLAWVESYHRCKFRCCHCLNLLHFTDLFSQVGLLKRSCALQAEEEKHAPNSHGNNFM